MSRTLISTGLALVLLAALVLPAGAADPIEGGLEYLAAQQQADGGFTNGFSEGSDLGTTCDAILAIAAAGEDASSWRSSADNSPLDYLWAQVNAGAVDKLGMKSKVVMALMATGLDPTSFGGRNLISEIQAAYDESTGSFGSTVFDHALAMLALYNAGYPLSDGMADYLLENQCTDGAWALFGGTTPGTGDTNTTAMAIQALLVTGNRDDIGGAFAYLQRVQNEDGGFPYQDPSPYGTDTDANSTAYVLQALRAADESMAKWTPAGTDPVGALAGLYDPESKGFFWQASQPFPNVLATAQAIPALEGYTFVSLPQAGVAQPPGAATSTPLLPESGGGWALPLTLGLSGLALLGTGLKLRRRDQ